MLWHFKGTEREKVSSPDILPHLQVVEVVCYCFIDAVTRYKTPRWGTKDLLLITQSSMSMVSALSSVPQVPWRWHSGLQVNTESTLGFIHCWNHWFGEKCCFLYWVLSLLCRDTLHPPLWLLAANSTPSNGLGKKSQGFEFLAHSAGTWRRSYVPWQSAFPNRFMHIIHA